MKHLLLIILLLALAGCGAETPTTVSQGGPTAAPSPVSGAAPTNIPTAEPAAQPTAAAATATVAASPVPAAQPTAAAATPTIEPTVVAALEKSGGFAGITNQLVVWDDGRLELSGGGPGVDLRTGQATPEQVAALQAIVDSAEFQALNDQYMPKETCCDLFTYVVSAGPKTITTMDGVAWPTPLANAIEMLAVLESQVGATR